MEESMTLSPFFVHVKLLSYVFCSSAPGVCMWVLFVVVVVSLCLFFSAASSSQIKKDEEIEEEEEEGRKKKQNVEGNLYYLILWDFGNIGARSGAI